MSAKIINLDTVNLIIPADIIISIQFVIPSNVTLSLVKKDILKNVNTLTDTQDANLGYFVNIVMLLFPKIPKIKTLRKLSFI